MDVGYFVIAILGCGDGSSSCTPLMTAPTRYSSEATCSAAAPFELARNTDLDAPTLLATCRRVDAPLAADRRPPQEVPAGARRS